MRTCSFRGCTTRPIFGKEWGKPIRCSGHKDDDHADVVNRKCDFTGCTRQPKFGKYGGKAIRCSEHKNDDHMNVVNRMCDFTGCMKHPVFGKQGGKPTRCSKHKHDDHIDVVNRKCEFSGCTRYAAFGKQGGKPTRCSKHKYDDHINVVARRCDFTGCTRHPAFGKDGGKATRCSEHKNDDHINVASRRCDFTGCTRQPAFGKEGDKATRCSEHKNDDHLNVLNRRCGSLGCGIYDYYERPFATRVDPETNTFSLCCFCWRKLYPHLDNHIKVRKEHFVLAEIQRQVPELDPYLLVHDCKIPGQSCVTARPDMCWIVNDTMIHVEIDEDGNQHEDDDDRLVAIHSATEAMNHICIRFNPDKTQNHPPCLKKIRTCGGEHILRKNDFEWERRICVLIRNIREVFEKCHDGQGCDIAGKRKLFFN